MEQYQPVDGDPFTGASLQPVNGDPFAEATGGVSMSQGDYASAGQKLGSTLSQTWPARMAVGAYDAMMAPGDYMQGKISTEEAERQAFNAAGLVMSGGVLSGVEKAAGEAILGSGPMRLYRGEYSGNKGGNFYSTDPEFARQFTQSGQESEVLNRQMPSEKVYEPLSPVYAGDEAGVDKAIAAAKEGGYHGVRLSEGQGQPDSVFVFNKGSLSPFVQPKLEPVSGDPFQPIIAYHGSDRIFNEFDPSQIGSTTDAGHLGQGFYFSTDPKVTQGSVNKMSASLDVRNPLNVSMPDFRTDKRTVVRNALGLSSDAAPADINAALAARGHDGVVLDYSLTGYNHQEIMVPNASQITTTAQFVDRGPIPPSVPPQLPPMGHNGGPSIIAYHGSPHDFDAFDMSKIGTGEGAQAYGHGLYFADQEAIAQDYKTNLAKPDFNFTKSGAPISSEVSRMLNDGYEAAASQGIRGPSVNDAVFMAQKNLEAQRAQALKAGDFDWFGKVADQQSELHRVSQDQPQMGGKMYQVQINANPDHFLDWDKPLSEQHPVVQDLARNADLSHLKPGNRTRRQIEMWREGVPMNSLEEPSGHVLYNALTDYGTDTASNAALTEKLQQAGIPGIKYLDAGSRSAGDGTRNYVVFNHDIINIIKKYGIGGLGIGTAAGIKHFQTQPVNNDPYSSQNPGGVI